jgi:hypothetical protein
MRPARAALLTPYTLRLTVLRRIQHHRVTLNGTKSVTGISSINKEQTDILAALTIKKPTLDTQLTLL